MIRGSTSMMLALALILSLPVRADDAPVSIAAALQQPVEANWEQVPLGEVLGRFAAQQNCNLVIDEVALVDFGIDLANTPVVDSLGETTWQSALQFLLDQHKLEMIPDEENNLLRVTTSEAAMGRLNVQAHKLDELSVRYGLTALPGGEFRMPSTAQPSEVLSGYHALSMDLMNGQWCISGSHHTFDSEATGRPAPLLNALPGLEWNERDGEGGTAVVQGKLLIVRQTASGQEWVRALLAGLQAMTQPDATRPPSVPVVRDRDQSPRTADITARLQDLGTWPAEVMTLDDAIIRLRTDMGLPIWIDRTGLAEAGISLDQEVGPVALRNVPWKLIVDTLFQQYGITVVVERDHLRATTIEVAAFSMVECRLYDTAELHFDEECFARLRPLINAKWTIEDGLPQPNYAILESELLFVAQPAHVQDQVAKLLDLLRSQPDSPAPEPRFVLRLYRAPAADQVEDLQLALRHLIAADWPDDSIQRIGSTLAIRQTVEVHRRIEALMTALQQVTPTAPAVQPNAKPEPVEQPARSGISSGGGGFFQRPVESGE